MNRFGFIFLLFIAIATHRIVTAEDVYTSLSDMENLIDVEAMLIDDLKAYVAADEKKLDNVKRFFVYFIFSSAFKHECCSFIDPLLLFIIVVIDICIYCIVRKVNCLLPFKLID